MPIPTTDEMILPILQHISDGQEYRRLSLLNVLTERFSLTEDERKRLSKSGQMEKSLSNKGFIERATQKWHYRITTRGLEVLNQDTEEDFETEVDNQPPEDVIEENYQAIRAVLAAELLQQIKNNTSTFFEELVIDLLVAMGYGGSREDAQAVGRSRDGGIDGIINEDRLGLDVIYVQVKRWGTNVGEPPLRDFVGALDGKGVQKGIFITTSDFYPAAKNYAERSSKKVILINGDQLAEYMIKHNVGVSVEKTYEIKRVDSDYLLRTPKVLKGVSNRGNNENIWNPRSR